MSEHLVTLLEGDLRPRILLVGDVMLDRYIWGDVERISPEAPVPILRIERQDQRLGGAGSVASMLAALGAETSLAAVTGNDPEGRAVRQLLAEISVDCSALLVDPKRITTVKQRLLGRTHQKHPHHMMRVDQEQTEPIGHQTRQQLLEAVAARIAQADLILISDYNKGVCAGEMIPRLVELARSAGVPIVADPIKGADYRRYAGCTCITPNRVEAGMAAGMKVITPQDGLDAAVKLLQFGVQAVLVTLDRDGMAWADCWGNQRLFPCRPREVADVTGAGDMVLSTLGYCLAIGADFPAAIEIANIAGGLEVERLGVVPLSRREIIAELTRSRAGSNRQVRKHREVGSGASAFAPCRAADRDDQRLLRPAAPRPCGLAPGGPTTRRLPGGGPEQRSERAGNQRARQTGDRPARPGGNAGRAGVRGLRGAFRRTKRGRSGRAASTRCARQSQSIRTGTSGWPRHRGKLRGPRGLRAHERRLLDKRHHRPHR
jgi:D-beta-D-heptose 7-phosphate kinase/D-beta-D-heptose 1-phosphate adenosyltransferase